MRNRPESDEDRNANIQAFLDLELPGPKLVYEIHLQPLAVVQSADVAAGWTIYAPGEVDSAIMALVEGGECQLTARGRLIVFDSEGQMAAGLSASFENEPDKLATFIVRLSLALAEAATLESFKKSVWELLTAERVCSTEGDFRHRVHRHSWLSIAEQWCAHECSKRAASDPIWAVGVQDEWWLAWYVRRVNAEKPFGPGEGMDDAVFHPDRHLLRGLLKAVDTASTNDEKKKSLEKLAAALLQWVEGLQVVGSVRPATGEVDLLVRNMCEHPMIRVLGERWLVEAKNWQKKVGTDEVGAFLTDLAEAGCKVGLLLSIEGISGGAGKDAWQRVFAAYQRDRTVVISLTRKDLEAIATGANLVTIMLQRYEEVTLGRVPKAQS